MISERGGAFTSLTSVGAGFSFGVQSWAPAAGYQMGFATGPEAIFAGRWRETAFQGREVKVRKLGNGSRSSVATLASATAN